jgi:hypothetical protein
MSKAQEMHLERIEQVLNCNRVEALLVYEVIEDYFDLDYSEMTGAEFDITVKAAHELMPEVL